MKKIIFRATIIIVIAGLAGAFYVYRYIINKPHPDYEKMAPAYVMLAADLFESYRTDRSMAEERFNGQVVQLNGTFDMIEQNDSLFVGVFVFDEGIFGAEGIRCTMLASQNDAIENSVSGPEVRVKGYVTGYNDTDVILEKCSIVN